MPRWSWRPTATNPARPFGCFRRYRTSGARRRRGSQRACARRWRDMHRGNTPTFAVKGRSLRTNSPQCSGRSGSGPFTTCTQLGVRTRTGAVTGVRSLKTRGRGSCKNRRETRSPAHPAASPVASSERVSESYDDFLETGRAQGLSYQAQPDLEFEADGGARREASPVYDVRRGFGVDTQTREAPTSCAPAIGQLSLQHLPHLRRYRYAQQR